MSELLGQGGYGCVYWPEIMCSGKIGSNKFVSKIQKNNFASNNEYNIGKIVKNIKNYRSKFVPAISSCHVKLSTINKNVVKDCNVLKPNNEYISMKFPYVKHSNFDKFFNRTDKKVFYLIEMYKKLVYSLELLADKNIVHHDLKEDNLIIDYKHNPLIIDFGISININDLTIDNYDAYFYVFATNYYPWSIELHIISYIVQERDNDDIFGKVSIDEINTIIDSYISSTIFFNLFTTEFVANYKEALKNNFKYLANKDNQSIINILLKTYRTWDMVSLSILFLKRLTDIYNNKIPNTKFIKELLEILLENISPYSDKRLSHKKTIERINKLKNNTANDFYNSIN